MIYTIYDTQISLFIDDTPYSIPEEDFRFLKIKTLLLSEQFSEVKKIVDCSSFFDPESKLVYHQGSLFFKDEKLPASLGDLILQAKIKEQDFSHYLNFFIALKYNKDFMANPNKRKMFYRKFKDVFVLDNIVVYDSEVKLNIENFYDFNDFPTYFQKELVNSGSIDYAIGKIAGFKSNKLLRDFKESVFSSKINSQYINFLALSKSLIDPAMVYSVWEVVRDKFKIKYPNTLNCFLAKYKNSQKSIISFLTDSSKDSLSRLDTLIFDHQELQVELPEVASAQELLPLFQREISRNKGDLYFLHLEKHFPLLLEMETLVEDLQIVVPQHNHELNEWSRLMNNCIATYSQKARKGQTLLLGVKRGPKLLYNLEIKQGKMEQFLAKNNSKVQENDKKKLEQFLRKNNILK